MTERLPAFTQAVYEFIVRADAAVGVAAGRVLATNGDAGKWWGL